MPTLQNTIQNAQNCLAAANVDNPALDARLLIAHVLGCERHDLITQPNRLLTETEIAAIDALITRRKNREPVARILGLREFWGLPFALNEATLDPRPDSETLIESTLKTLKTRHPREGGDPAASVREPYKAKHINILDLGTGTGCLLLALLHELPEATGLGLDISPRAIEQAQANAARLGLSARATFRVNNWLENLTSQQAQENSLPLAGRVREGGERLGGEPNTTSDNTIGTFDLIISNPPYIKSADIPTLMPEVSIHDPHAALDGGADGLAAYRHLIPQLPNFLNPGGLAVFEIGQGQAEAVQTLFRASGFTSISANKDLAGIDRCIAASASEC